jgi:phosphoglycolate phosphatase
MPALVFDLDGTLVDTRPDLAAAINAVLRAEGHDEVAMESLGHLYGHGGRAMLRKALADQGVVISDDGIERMNADFVDAYRADIARLSRPFPGVREALKEAAETGWKLAVCTNKREDLAHELLEALDLLSPFSAIVGGNTFPRAKPDAMPLLGAIERAGGDRLHSVMVGDSQTDVDAARAAGVPVVAVTFGYTAIPVRDLDPDAVIDAFSALAAALEHIGRSPARVRSR